MAKRKPHSIGERPTSLAKYLTTERINKELTQAEVGKNIKASKSSICRIERGERRRQCLRGYILYQLADAYGVPLGEVLRRANWPQLLLLDANKNQKKQLAQYLKENL